MTEHFLRYSPQLTFTDTDYATVKPALMQRFQAQPHLGDDVLEASQREGRLLTVHAGGLEAGFIGYDSHSLTLFDIHDDFLHLAREILECALDEFGLTEGYVYSWDARTLPVFMDYAAEVGPQAYLFAVLNTARLKRPEMPLQMRPATPADLPTMQDEDFPRSAPLERIRTFRNRAGEIVGHGFLEPIDLAPLAVAIGNHVQPHFRRQGIGSAILAELARHALGEGKTPVAGCWWKNAESRRTVERAGLDCVGTLLRVKFKPPRPSPR